MFLIFLVFGCGDNGIHMHPSGDASYVGGEACTVHAHAGIDREEYRAMLEWCEEKYIEDRRVHSSYYRIKDQP